MSSEIEQIKKNFVFREKPRFLVCRYNAKFNFLRPLNTAAWDLCDKYWDDDFKKHLAESRK